MYVYMRTHIFFKCRTWEKGEKGKLEERIGPVTVANIRNSAVNKTEIESLKKSFKIRNLLQTCHYANGNDLISFNIKNDKTKATLTHMYIELAISIPTTTSTSMKEMDNESAT